MRRGNLFDPRHGCQGAELGAGTTCVAPTRWGRPGAPSFLVSSSLGEKKRGHAVARRACTRCLLTPTRPRPPPLQRVMVPRLRGSALAAGVAVLAAILLLLAPEAAAYKNKCLANKTCAKRGECCMDWGNCGSGPRFCGDRRHCVGGPCAAKRPKPAKPAKPVAGEGRGRGGGAGDGWRESR